ncbi:MAG: DNA-binding response OmpR family regulator [Lentimonas sp.]|jgi:DNA-binding response OmpR family regulator
MKIVAIIEDQTAIREMLIEAFFNSAAFQILIECRGSLQGGEQCIEQKLDLVLLVALLPNLNGTGVLRRFTTEIPRDTRSHFNQA